MSNSKGPSDIPIDEAKLLPGSDANGSRVKSGDCAGIEFQIRSIVVGIMLLDDT
jgi:hypothetical protein